MAVLIKTQPNMYEPGAPHKVTNKPLNIPFKEHSYTARRTVVLRPKIDKISFTYTIPDTILAQGAHELGVPFSPEMSLLEKTELVEKLYAPGFYSWANDKNDALNPMLQTLPSDQLPPKSTLSQVSEDKGRYKLCYDLTHPATGARVRISLLHSVKEPKSHLRMEFNPSELGVEGMEFLKEQLHCNVFYGTPSWVDIITEAKITRLDIAVDLLGVKVDDLIVSVQHSDASRKRVLYQSADCKLETVYPLRKPGKKQSGKDKYIIYNKTKELTDKVKGNPYEWMKRTRVEVRLNGKNLKKPLHKVHEYKSHHLSDLTVIDPTGNIKPPENQLAWEMFLDSCRFRGVDAALNRIYPVKLRKLYQEALRDADKDVWRPKKLWGQLEEAIQRSGLLEDMKDP